MPGTSPGMTKRGGPGEGGAAREQAPFIPTISCINISLVPQVLGQFRAMWYLAGFFRPPHMTDRFAPKGLRRWRYFVP